MVPSARAKEFIPLELEARVELAKLNQKSHSAGSTGELIVDGTLAAEHTHRPALRTIAAIGQGNQTYF